jgi:hypothetical protein
MVGFQGIMAATATISLVPTVLGLQIYGGDRVNLLITVSSIDGPTDLSGEVEAQVRVKRTDPSPVVEFEVDMTNAADGQVLLSLSSADTDSLHGTPPDSQESFNGLWDVQWTPEGDASSITLVQGTLNSLLGITRP